VIRVFVSSPGDVAAERGVLNEVVDRINLTDGLARGVPGPTIESSARGDCTCPGCESAAANP
jgi:hypothetical protein